MTDTPLFDMTQEEASGQVPYTTSPALAAVPMDSPASVREPALDPHLDGENMIPKTPTLDSASLDYNFTADLPCVTEVLPVPWENFDQARPFPTDPQKAVIHQFGTPGVDTIESTVRWFINPEAETSAHFVVSGHDIVQMVSLKDRAWHAGPGGNDFVGIETDPNQDSDTIASVVRLLKDLRDHYGYVLEPIKHSSIASTACGAQIDLANYDINEPAPEPTSLPAGFPEPEPTPEPEPAPMVLPEPTTPPEPDINRDVDLAPPDPAPAPAPEALPEQPTEPIEVPIADPIPATPDPQPEPPTEADPSNTDQILRQLKVVTIEVSRLLQLLLEQE